MWYTIRAVLKPVSYSTMKKVVTANTGKADFLKLIRLSAALLSLFSIYSIMAVPRARADQPVKFTYQGNLRQNGFLVNGTRNMVFKIYTSSFNTTADWTSMPQNVQISTGVFRVSLDPDLNLWQNGNLWLQLVVEGTPMLPMEEITAAPYSVNTVLISGKKYTSASLAPLPAASNEGDLWYDINLHQLKYFNGTIWTSGSGAGLPGIHAPTHAGDGTDPITSIGGHTVTGPINLSAGASLIGSGATGVTVASNLSVNGVLNQYSNLSMGGPGFSVSVSSALNVLGTGIFLSTVTMLDGNLKYGSAPAGKVLKSGGDGFVYWGNDNSTPISGDPYYLVMFNATGDQIVNSRYLQNSAGTSVTLTAGSSLTVTGAFGAFGPSSLADTLDVAGILTARDGLIVTGADTTITNDLYVEGNSQLGNEETDLHSINRASEPGVALSVESNGASGSYAAKFYSGGSLAAWIRKK